MVCYSWGEGVWCVTHGVRGCDGVRGCGVLLMGCW